MVDTCWDRVLSRNFFLFVTWILLQPAHEDDPAESDKNPFTNKSIRSAFVRKVYLILLCQLAVVFSMAFAVVYFDVVKEWIKAHPYLLYVSIGVGAAVMVILSCIGKVRRKFPFNYIMLLIFTVTQGFLFGTIGCFMPPYAILTSISITAAIVLALTLFAMQTRWDFTTIRGFLICLSVVLVVVALCWLFLRDRFFDYLYSALGALLFSLFLVYDTQLMLGGRLYSIRPDEHVAAALNLYLDIVQIYMVIVKMFRST